MAGVDALVRARVREDVKEDADKLLSELGLSMSDYIRMSLALLLRDGTLPFNLTPNAATQDAMRDARKMSSDKKTRTFKSAATLFASLDGDA